jgi:hypothetical protein
MIEQLTSFIELLQSYRQACRQFLLYFLALD